MKPFQGALGSEIFRLRFLSFCLSKMPERKSCRDTQQNAGRCEWKTAKCRREMWKVASKNAGREICKSCTQQNAGREVVGKFCCVESDEGECGLGDYHLKPYPYTYFLATHTLGIIITLGTHRPYPSLAG